MGSSNPRLISDELVQDLSCQNLNAAQVFAHVKSSSYNSPSRHIPWQNWSFSVGLYDLANCWSLSRSQMLMYYMGSHEDAESTSGGEIDPRKLRETLDMIRGYVPSPVNEPRPEDSQRLLKRIPFHWTADYFRALTIGQSEFVAGRELRRDFKHDVEAYQQFRFNDLLHNWPYLTSGRERPVEANRETLSTLKKNLSENKLTLLLLRPHRLSQHVVLAKRIEDLGAGAFRIWVYDSNYPQIEQSMMFHGATEQFYAPDIIRGLPRVGDANIPIGVFVLDEKERDDVGQALVRYYQQRCEL